MHPNLSHLIVDGLQADARRAVRHHHPLPERPRRRRRITLRRPRGADGRTGRVAPA